MSALTTDLRLLRLERRFDALETRLKELLPHFANPQPDDAIQPNTEVIAERAAPLLRQAGASNPPPLPANMPPLPVVDDVPASRIQDERGAWFDPPKLVVAPVEPKPEPFAVQPPQRPAPSNVQYAPRRQPPARESRSPRQLEQTIGLKWAGWVGAVVLVIGAALGVKYGYDQHWFGNLPATVKLGFIAAAGFALIGAGEYVLRKIHAVPAASLFGAGVATLFVAAYVGHAYYGLYGARTSEIAMSLATLVGAAVAMRGNLVSIAVLALIGGNVAPLIVREQHAPAVALTVSFLAYLLMLQIVALTLAAWGKGGKWWTLRGLSLATTSFWVFAKLIPNGRHDSIVLSAMIAFAIAYHLELIITTIRKATIERSTAPGVTFSFFVTAALTIGVLIFHLDATRAMRGGWVIGIAAACGALGFLLPRIKPSLSPLGYAHRIAAVALTIVWIPVAFGGESILIGWLILSGALALSWVLSGSLVSRYATIVTWFLAALRLGIIVVDGRMDSMTWMHAFGEPISAQALIAWTLALVGFINARLITIRPRMLNVDSTTGAGDWLHTARVLSIIATAIWCAASIHYLPSTGATLMILAAAWGLMLPGELLASQLAPTLQSASLLVFVAVKWAILDSLAARLSSSWSATQYQPIFNPLMAMGGAIAASLAALYYLRGEALLRSLRRGNDVTDGVRTGSLLALIVAVIAIFTIGFSFEIDRTVERALPALSWAPWQIKQLSWTMLWCVSLAAIAAALLRLLDARRRASLGWLLVLPSLLAIKYIVIDTLLFALWGQHASRGITPLFNIQIFAGIVVLASVAFMRWLSVRGLQSSDMPPDAITMRRLRGQLLMLALIVVGWMGTMEIDRAVTWFGVAPGSSWHIKNLCFSMWWMICAAGTFATRRRYDTDASPTEAWLRVLPACVLVVALKFLSIDTILWRVLHGPMSVNILMNIEALTAAVVLAGLALVAVMGLPDAFTQRRREGLRNRMASLAVLVLLWAGSIEIDRAFALPSIQASVANPQLAEQVAMSIFWSLFAVATVIFGFVLRAARMRYFGLALLALTLLKVVVIDLHDVGNGYRILSFLGLGLLLLGTSVVYGKVSPKLLREASGIAGST